jgi:hypothetical protein
MNVVQLEVKSFKKLMPSSRMPRVMNAIPQILIIVSQEQQIGFVMPNTLEVACKLRQKSKPSRIRNNLRMFKVHTKYQ